jgi:hypothetical protein
MPTTGGPPDDGEGLDPTEPAPGSDDPDRSLAPQPGRAEQSAPDDVADDPAPEQVRQSQQ